MKRRSPRLDTHRSAGYELLVLDVPTGQVRACHPLPEGLLQLPMYLSGVDKIRWSPDGRRVLISWDRAAVIDVTTRGATILSRGNSITEWAPGGRGVYRLAIADPDVPRYRRLGALYLWTPDSTSTLADSARLEAAGIRQRAFLLSATTKLSPSGSRLALAAGARGDSTGIRLYDVAAQPRFDVGAPALTIATDAVVTAVERSPDETRLAARARSWERHHRGDRGPRAADVDQGRGPDVGGTGDRRARPAQGDQLDPVGLTR